MYIFQIVNDFDLDHSQICHICRIIMCESTISIGRHQL